MWDSFTWILGKLFNSIIYPLSLETQSMQHHVADKNKYDSKVDNYFSLEC